MTKASWLAIGVAALVLGARQDLDLDLESHRAFAKAGASGTAPPADLSAVAAGGHYVASR